MTILRDCRNYINRGKKMEKDDLNELYLKWIKAEKKTEELRKALDDLEKTAKKFTNEDITPSSSMFDGVHIIWESYNIWGSAMFYNPHDFINACINKNGGTK